MNTDRAADDPAVAAYVDGYLGDEGFQAVSDAGYVALTDDVWAETQAAWAGLAGTRVRRRKTSWATSSSRARPPSSRSARWWPRRSAQANPGAGVSVDGPGTGDGFELFCAGDTDISDASRPIEDEEIAACEDAGIEFVELKIGIDGLSLVTMRQRS